MVGPVLTGLEKLVDGGGHQPAQGDSVGQQTHPPLQQALAEAADPARCFYKIWTGKESYIKYLGTGLKKDLRSFSIFNLEGVKLFTPQLAQGYSLSLCTTEDRYALELLEGQLLR